MSNANEIIIDDNTSRQQVVFYGYAFKQNHIDDIMGSIKGR